MKCPKCHKQMKADVKSNKYICECGNEIPWSKEKDNSIKVSGFYF
jgi:tRNA(Ile2) C34 agmatinyltransferase TiaS